MLQLPDKQYFKIGEVADLLGVRASVLRYWETEFSTIRPEKTRSGQRLYTRRNVERLVEVRQLLYEQRYTIAGARRRLRDAASTTDETRAATIPASVLARIRETLQELLQLSSE